MAESGDEALGREADLADEHAHDESAEDTDADERDDVDETEDEDMADPRPERWSFLDLRGGHHALDLYHEVRLVVFLRCFIDAAAARVARRGSLKTPVRFAHLRSRIFRL